MKTKKASAVTDSGNKNMKGFGKYELFEAEELF